MTTLFFLLWFLNLLFVLDAAWSSTASTLITNRYQIAVGVLNDSIFLLGGRMSPTQVTEYRIDTDTFTNIGGTALSGNVYGYSQFYSQKNTILYMIDPPRISTFDLMTQQHTVDWINLEVDVGDGCLATTDHQLFVVGGYNGAEEDLDTLQVLDFSTLDWMSNPPNMIEARSYTCCIAYYDHLWAFSAYTGINTTTNERIDITNIASNEWNYIDSLNTGVDGIRAVGWQQSIFLIGGRMSTQDVLDTVHIVDVFTGTITVSSEKLVYPIYCAGVTLTNNVIYAFGGDTGDFITDKWMKYELPLININDSVILTSTATTTTTQYQSSIVPTLEPTDDDHEERKTDDKHNIWFIVGGIAASVCVLLMIMVFMMKRRNKERQRVDNNNNKMMRKQQEEENNCKQEVVRKQMVVTAMNEPPMQRDVVLQHGVKQGEESVSSSRSSLYNMEGLKAVDGKTAATASNTGGNTQDATTGSNTQDVTTGGIIVNIDDIYADGAADA